MEENKLTIQEAYIAMLNYLENLYFLTKSDDLAGFLGSMQLLDDKSTWDPAVWGDWIEAVEKVKKNRSNSRDKSE